MFEEEGVKSLGVRPLLESQHEVVGIEKKKI